MESHGFAQLACKHTFHLRCMVPSVASFWGNGPINCKICGQDEVAEAVEAAEAAPGRELTVEDAYRMVSHIEEKKYKDKVVEHVATLTKEQKTDLKTYIKTCRLGRKLRSKYMGELYRKKKNFITKNDHIIFTFNKAYRAFVKDIITSDLYKRHLANYKKNRKLYRKLTNEITNNNTYELEDIALALKYSRIPMYINFDVEGPRSFRYRFYSVSDKLFNVKKLGKTVY